MYENEGSAYMDPFFSHPFWQATWCAMTDGRVFDAGTMAIENGNLVLKHLSDNAVYWTTGLGDTRVKYAKLRNDGKLYLYMLNGTFSWCSCSDQDECTKADDDIEDESRCNKYKKMGIVANNSNVLCISLLFALACFIFLYCLVYLTKPKMPCTFDYETVSSPKVLALPNYQSIH